MNSILTWLATFILNYLKNLLLKEAASALEEHEKEKQQDATNAANLEKYNAAQSEAEQIQAALDLLNRRRS